MKKYVKLLCLLFISSCCLISCADDEFTSVNEISSSDVQNTSERQRVCGLEHHMERLLKDDIYRKNHEKKFIRLKEIQNSISSRALCSSPVKIPVAIHYQSISNPDDNCLRSLAQSQVDILNRDYQGINDDISTWINNASGTFPGVNYGETCIEFVIANQNHPSGFGLSDGDLAVTVNRTSGDQNNQWSGYLNVYVRPNTGALGYSPLGGSGNGDGVVIDAQAFGSGVGCGVVSSSAPYNLGRTLTHEAGHYFLLDHIWGNGCNQDDGVADTPSQAADNNGCPQIGVSSCGTADLHMNYMDYTNDACMYMFSAGQSSRMDGYLSSSLQNLVSNAAIVIAGEGGTTPSCSDGVQNGDETGVDCGGSCAPCQAAPTCTDGVQNGDETGVDCGGSCAPCQAAPTCTDGIQNGDETSVDCGGSCAPCDDNDTCEDYKIIVKPDDYGSEIEWVLFDEEGYVVIEGGPYDDFDRTADRQLVCLEDGCYTFLITDTYGDGICCYYGRGHYRIKDSNGHVVVRSNGRYGYYEVQDFCVGDGEFRLENTTTDLAQDRSVAKEDPAALKQGQQLRNEIKAWVSAKKEIRAFKSH